MDRKKVTVKEIQRSAGLLNFLNKAIYPGRVFTHKTYTKMDKLKDHHHVSLDSEFKADCQIWLYFLRDSPATTAYNRPFIDLLGQLTATDVLFYADASATRTLGFWWSNSE